MVYRLVFYRSETTVAFAKGHNPNHPEKDAAIRVEPIRDARVIEIIKQQLAGKPRDRCLFTLGINTAFRANELLSITIRQVQDLKAGDPLRLRQTKTKKTRSVPLNSKVIEDIELWLAKHPARDTDPDCYLFTSQRGAVLTVPTITGMVKNWVRNAKRVTETEGLAVDLRGNFGSHTLRKTWGYHQRMHNNAQLPVLMDAFGHTTQRQTLQYLGIEEKEIAELYEQLEL